MFVSAVHVSFKALPFLPLKPLALKISCKRSTDVFLSHAFTVSGLNIYFSPVCDVSDTIL